MDPSKLQKPSTQNFSAKKERAQVAISQTTNYQGSAQENESRDVLTNFDIFDFTGMERLSGAEVAAFSEILFCFHKGRKLTSRIVLGSLRDILTKARKEWSDFELETGNAPEPEDELLFWFMFWDKYQPGEQLKIANPTTLIRMVSYYGSGFKSMLNNASIYVDLDGLELSCAVRVAVWLQTTQDLKISCSFNTPLGTDFRKRRRVSGGADEQHRGDQAQLQYVQQELGQMTSERDEAKKQCAELRGLLEEEISKREAISLALKHANKQHRESLEHQMQFLESCIRRELPHAETAYNATNLFECILEVQYIGAHVDDGVIERTNIKSTLEDVMHTTSDSWAGEISCVCSEILSDWSNREGEKLAD
ncbi:hypothetical protein F5X99DRAFT_424613 [Biscogniauxia marginata]|nr:hypothetical protein F5X99DRAFT_424613 [Biscogniauxia marginata]